MPTPEIEAVQAASSFNWDAVTALSTTAMVIVILVSVVYVARQLHEVRRSNYFQAFAHIREMLQAPGLPEARGTVYKWKPGSMDLSVDGTDSKLAKDVCRTFDTLGTMVQHGMIPKRMAIDLWGEALIKTYRVLGPSLDQYREKIGRPGFWVNYGWLACEAERHGVKVRDG